MEWLSQNWVWVLLGIGFIAMHMFGHGGHAGHGSSDRKVEKPEDKDKQRASKQGSGRQH
jgi:hypothetical protein